jgi:alkylation response protein AidB-like acyl-CoA dehydrogenase
MDFGLTEQQEQWRARVRGQLRGPEVRAHLRRLRESAAREPDVRPLYRTLGTLGLLAVNWPKEYGGQGAGLIEAAIVAEELVRAGVPDTLHVNTIQIVGLFLLLVGTPGQKAKYLPPLARGEQFASVLYTEPDSGSDLASLRTTAVPDGEGYRINGVKIFSLKSHITDFALCAARTSEEASKYQGITLFLVDLHTDGVRRTTIASIPDEQFHRVELRDVYAGPDRVIGRPGEGWPLLVQALAIERTGLDYTLKAERWYAATVTGLGHGAGGAVAEEAARYGAALRASSLMAWHVVRGLASGEADETAAAAAKYYSSELARSVASWAVRVHGAGYRAHRIGDDRAAILDAAYREAPGLTVSAGTSEVMLEIIAGSLNEGIAGCDGDAGTTFGQVREAIRRALSARPAPNNPHAAPAVHSAEAPAWPALLRLTAPRLELPLSAGGLELGLEAGVIAAEELGRAGHGSPYLGVVLALNALTANPGTPGGSLVAALAEGEVSAAPAGFEAAPLRVRPAEQEWRLSGTVVAAADADVFCLPVTVREEPALAVVAAHRLGQPLGPARGGGLLLRLDNVPLTQADLACRGQAAAETVRRAQLRQAAYLLGLAEGAHAEAVRYAGRRHQFGQPLRDFQSVSFRLADAAVRLWALRLLVYWTARQADTGGIWQETAPGALAYAAETGLEVVYAAAHVCGARGLTGETLTQRYYRMVMTEAVRYGPPAWLWRACPAGR